MRANLLINTHFLLSSPGFLPLIHSYNGPEAKVFRNNLLKICSSDDLLFSSPEHHVFKGSFSGGAVSVDRRPSSTIFQTSFPPKPLGQLGPNLAGMFLGRSCVSTKNSGCHGNEMEFF